MTDRAMAAAGILPFNASAGNSAANTATHYGIHDLDQAAEYAQGPMSRMLEAGWLKGYNGAVNPIGTATRAEAAILLYNISKSL